MTFSRIERAARSFLRGDLSRRIGRAAVERKAFDEAAAGEFLGGEIPDGVTVSGLDYTVEDSEPTCPKCPHWRHAGDHCSTCSCRSIFVGNTTRETGPRFFCVECSKAITTPMAIPANPGLFCSVRCEQAAKTSASTAVFPPEAAPVSPNVSDLLVAATNQLELWRTGARLTRQRAQFLCELVPDLNAAASQLPADLAASGTGPGEVCTDSPDPAPSPGRSIPELLCNGSMAIGLLLDGEPLHNIAAWRQLADDMHTKALQLIQK